MLFRTRLDMGPDNMADMTAQHQTIPATEVGVYRFKADLTMAGGWALRLMAKVPGEAETVLAAAGDEGLDLDLITTELEREGVESFCSSYRELLDCIKTKLAALSGHASIGA